jgi:hypothetical protein
LARSNDCEHAPGPRLEFGIAVASGAFQSFGYGRAQFFQSSGGDIPFFDPVRPKLFDQALDFSRRIVLRPNRQ